MKARIRPAVALGLVAALAVLSACTVRPLYSNAPVRAGSSATMSDELSSIAIKPVTTREAQEVRNRLISCSRVARPSRRRRPIRSTSPW